MKLFLASLLAGLGVWIARMAVTIPFLDENGRLPVVLEDGRLPGNVEYFFTGLMIIYCLAAAFAAWLLLGRFRDMAPVRKGMVIAAGLTLTVLVIDAILEMAVAHRGWAHHLRNVVIDYVPLIIIPVFGGLLLAAERRRL